MAFRLGVDNLRVSDGTQIEVPERGVLVFVGPNNAGKSADLRGIQLLLNRTPLGPGQEPKVIQQLDIQQAGTVEEFREWVDHHAVREQRGFETVYKRPGGAEMAWSTMEASWAAPGN